jgi:uncharacterized RDD family membrane protein YckC
MKPEEIYIDQVLSKLPAGAMRNQIAMELRSHIADRVERGHSVEEAIKQLGDPAALAESYLSAVPLVPAPHLRRIGAKFLDMIIPIAFACTMAAWWTFGMPHPLGHDRLEEVIAIAAAAFVMMGLALNLIYLVVAESRFGQTLGKHVFGLRVVTESGTRISIGQAFVRYLPIFFQVGWIDALFALFTDKRQRAFEMLTKTRVVMAQESHRSERAPIASPLPVAL